LNKEVLTQARLRQLLSYSPESGLIVWRRRSNNSQFNSHFAGKIAGTKQSAGYIQIGIDGKKYLAHRLVFLYIRGSFPRGNVDHVNHIPSDNRFENLRSGSQSQNRANSRQPCTNTSGKKGVYYRRDYGNWFAQIHKDGKTIYLGIHDSIDQAAAAYAAAAKQIFGDFARID
jgi:hypothetical protein